MSEINLLNQYPQLNRDVKGRFAQITDQDRLIAKQFGKEFFDGSRLSGYGGYKYDGRWKKVAETFRDHYHLDGQSSLLDVGCAKGFMLQDFVDVVPGITLAGIDISEYAIEQAPDIVKPFVSVGDAKDLSKFGDKSFDLVISITTIHNLSLEECKNSLREIQRVSKRDAFIVVDAYRNHEERERMLMWNLTAKTYMHTAEWKHLFDEVGYTGDYYWFIP